MKKKPRLLLWTVFVLTAAALAWAFRPQPVEVDVAVIQRGPMMVTVDHEGRTRVKDRFVISAPLSGRLQRAVLKPGDPVVAGETVVALIEPTDPELLNPRALAQAEARVKAAQAAVLQAEPNVQRAHSAWDLAKIELDRTSGLVPSGGAPRSKLDEAAHREQAAREELHAAEFAKKVAEFELELAKAALLYSKPSDNATGEDQGPRMAIRSPITGRVFRVIQESSKVVTPGEPLIELADPTNIEIEVDVLSTDAVKIHPGTRMIVDHWGGDTILEARVRTVEPSAFTKVSALGIEEQRVNVIADFVDPPEKRSALGDGYRIEARLVVWESEDVLIAPAGALFREGGEWSVFALRDDKAVLQKVKLDHRNDLQAEVLEGLAKGDTVVLYPSDKIADDIRVMAEE
ncbi:MAG: HlyD family efflux transporter periplasmic adaptor subunit [Prosthecobacter sp.]